MKLHLIRLKYQNILIILGIGLVAFLGFYFASWFSTAIFIALVILAIILLYPKIGRINDDLRLEGNSICLVRHLKCPHVIINKESINDYTKDIKKRYRIALADLFTPFIHGKEQNKKYTRTFNRRLKKYNKKGKSIFTTKTNGTIFKYLLDYFNIENAIQSLTEAEKHRILKELLPEADSETTNFLNTILLEWSKGNSKIKNLLSLPDETSRINATEIRRKKDHGDFRTYNINNTMIRIRALRKTKEEKHINEALYYICPICSNPDLVNQMLEKGKRHKFKIKITLTKSI